MSDRRRTHPRDPAPPHVTDPPPELAGAIVTSEALPSAAPVGEIIEELSSDDLEEIEEFEVVDDTPRRLSAAPAAPPPPAPAPVPSGPPVAASQHKDASVPVVLVVEDDGSIRSMIVRALGLHYTVYEAEDGADAVRVLGAIASPACIVSDWMMPRMDGLELAKHVRGDAKLRGVPFLFLTAKNGALDVVQGINAGARHYLAKPFKMKELMDKVGAVIGPRR